MSGIAALAMQWLTADKKVPGSAEYTSHHIIESLLAEIRRVEAVNIRIAEDLVQLRTEGMLECRLAVAEECAVICETADYVVRSYGCAHEIRLKFGLPLQKNTK
jgi:hypothetical protein